MKQVIVIGGGAAGMMAAIWAARSGNQVTILEKNEKLGKKLFITGKGRCNITNGCDISDLFLSVVSNEKFMYSSFYSFSNEDVIAFFEELGVKTKKERGNRIFPLSDKSSDVIRALQRECQKCGVRVELNCCAKKILTTDGYVCGVKDAKGTIWQGDSVILCTGGVSYSSTGSTGDGFEFAKEMGHHITPLRPGLVGMVTKEQFPKELQGLTLKNVGLKFEIEGKKRKLLDEVGELLFTHYGVSGPLILTASSLYGDVLQKDTLKMHIDCKPGLTLEQLDKRILRDFSESMNLDIANALIHLLPKRMISVILDICEISGHQKVNTISKAQRERLVSTIKDVVVRLDALRGMDEAIITRGGVKVSEVDPSTMESKIIPGLFFAGEVLDVDALTGGYNLQIAWSTAYLAGTSQ